MRISRFLVVLGFVSAAVVLVLHAPPVGGTPEFAKKEGNKDCVYCHTAFGKPDLNDMGKCYKDHKNSLTDCPPKKP